MNHSAPEFSRILFADRVSPSGSEEQLEAKPAERAALARRFDLIDLPALTAALKIRHEQRGALAVSGTVTADVVQRCVVTLEQVVTHLEIPVELVLLPAGDRREDPLIAGEEEEDFDYYVNGRVDLGELTAQHLGINLDPYPRKEGASLPKTEFGPAPEARHPFAGLAKAVNIANNQDKSKD